MSVVNSVLDPIVSEVHPIETALATPLQTVVSDVVSEATEALLPIATPVASGLLSALTRVALPVVTPIICDIVASDVEHSGLGLNAGCSHADSSITLSEAAPTKGFLITNDNVTTSADQYVSGTVATQKISASTDTVPTSPVAPCVVTSTVQEVVTRYVYQNASSIPRKTVTATSLPAIQTIIVTISDTPYVTVAST